MYKYHTKRYLHIDRILFYTDKIKSYVENPEKVSQHGFFPFLKYMKNQSKFLGYDKDVAGKRKTKERQIMVASHIDGFIYSHYGSVISEKYNEWALLHGIDECSIAYRNNKKGKSNIQFAAEVITTIIKYQKCYIWVGDFTKFFDNLNHKCLKQCLRDVLNVTHMSKDYYQVLKSLTNYSYIDLKQLRYLLTQRGINFEKNKRYFSSIKEFRKFQQETKLTQKNTGSVGIPQGSALSGLLANIYMIHVDEEIQKIVQSSNGIYRRYSDDFIIVIPATGDCSMIEFGNIQERIKKIIKLAKVELQQEKTVSYVYENEAIWDFDSYEGFKKKNSAVTYLGFRFDGKIVSARQRSVYKFYRGAKKTISRAVRLSKKKNSKTLLRQSVIIKRYMDVGSKPKWDKRHNRLTYGNFISYMLRAQKEFEKIDGVECKILEQIKHRQKIIAQYRNAKQRVKR